MMLKRIKNLDQRSEEVQDIITQIPSWIVRNGTIVILLIVIGLILGSYFYKYPDIIAARVTLSSVNPPIPVFSEVNGKLAEILKADNELVDAGDVIGVIENSGSYTDILELKEQIREIDTSLANPDKWKFTLKKDLHLGTVYSLYAQYVSAYQNYARFSEFDNQLQRINSLRKQAVSYGRLSKLIDEKVFVLRNDLRLSHKQFKRDSMLYASNAISTVEFERSHSQFLKQEYSYRSMVSEAYDARIQFNQISNEIIELTSQRAEQDKILRDAFKLSVDNLLNQIVAWEQLYLLKAPIGGKISFTTVFSPKQYITTAVPVFTVVPENNKQIIGRVTFPIKGSGNVHPGQRINIKLDNFPYTEYGMLVGTIEKISLIPFTNQDGAFYVGEVVFPNKLVTNYQKELPFHQEMQGVGEIITKDKRLIDRLIDPIKSLFYEQTTTGN